MSQADSDFNPGTNGEASPRGYEDILALAAACRRPVAELLALASKNDPFYAGVSHRRVEAEWFAALWHRYQISGAHLRRIHYIIVSDDPPPLMPDSKSRTSNRPYANTEECWQFLNKASRDARHLGLVPPDGFADHRNAAPVLVASETQSPDEPGWGVEPLPPWAAPAVWLSAGGLGAYGMPEMPSVTVEGYDYEAGDQPCHVELWVEKTTMNDVLIPICRELHVNLVALAGFQTVTGTIELLRRLDRLPADKPARIGYISDFDPAGFRMPAAVARVVEFYLDQYAPGRDIKLTPLALTHEQVLHHRLPRIPIKEEDLRRRGFEERFGEGAVELDALEALHPGELGRIVRDFISPYRDPTLAARLAEARETAHEEAQEAWDAETENHRRGLEVLQGKIRRVVEAVRPEAERLNDRLQAALAPLLAKVGRVRHAIDATSVTVDLPERPEPETPEVDESAWLYASGRGYMEQLGHYPPQERRSAKKVVRSTIQCRQCGTPFVPKRKDATCCSTRCRVAFNRAKASK
jgi:hypothetical protein